MNNVGRQKFWEHGPVGPLPLYPLADPETSSVGTGGSGGSVIRGPSSWGPRVVGQQKNFRQAS